VDIPIPAAPKSTFDHRSPFVLRQGGPEVEHRLDLGYHIREAGSTASRRWRSRSRTRGVRTSRARGGACNRRVRPAALVLLQRAQQLLEEVAKFRAARRMWARMMRRSSGNGPEVVAPAISHPDCGLLAHRAATRKQRRARHCPDDGGGGGGTQSLHTNAMDEALSLPSEGRCAWRCGRSRSWRTSRARRRGRSVGGAWWWRRDRSHRGGSASIRRPDRGMGGALAAIERDSSSARFMRRPMPRSAPSSRGAVVVGVNRFRLASERQSRPSAWMRPRSRADRAFGGVRRRRDGVRVSQTLTCSRRLPAAART